MNKNIIKFKKELASKHAINGPFTFLDAKQCLKIHFRPFPAVIGHREDGQEIDAASRPASHTASYYQMMRGGMRRQFSKNLISALPFDC